MPLAKRPVAGYSLVEILIVVSLMVLLAGLIIPQFNPGVHTQLQTAAELVVTDLEYTRTLAVTNNSRYQLTFNTDQNHYVLEHTGSSTLLDALPPTPFRRSDDPPDKHYTYLDDIPRLGPGVWLQGVLKMASSPQSATDVEFGPLGGTTRSEETVIWLSSGTGEARRYIFVSVNPATGLGSVGDFVSTAPTLPGPVPPS